MSHERQDVRGKLDPDMKDAFRVMCDIKGVTEAEFIESILVPVIEQFVHDSIAAADELRRRGITGNNRAKPGQAGNAVTA
jgi:hypothetical protein